jgi:hypothetical protein
LLAEVATKCGCRVVKEAIGFWLLQFIYTVRRKYDC